MYLPRLRRATRGTQAPYYVTLAPAVAKDRMKFPPSRQFLVPMIVACALFMENLDSTVIATALPAIARSLDENPLRLNLAITAYLLSLAVFIPVSGWMADRFGARGVFRTAIVVFTLASICCGLVDSLGQLVIARIAQGIGGAMMVPVGRLVMLRAVPKADLVTAMAYLTFPALIGPVVGPPLGGFIVTYSSWRWIFLINVPIGVLGVALVSLFIPDTRPTGVPRLDLPGLVLTGCGLSGVMFAFETTGRGVLPGWATASLGIFGAACLALYWRHARRVANPVIDLTLLRIPTFAIGVIGASLFRVGIGALPFLLPLMLQLGFGMNALNSGLLTFASAAGAMTMKTTARMIIRRFGFRRVLVVNGVVSSLFLFVCGLFRPETPHVLIFAALLGGGFFRSLQFTGSNALSFADVPTERMSRATSFASMAQQLSISAGVGTGALLLHLTLTARDEANLSAASFTPAFIGIGVISVLCAPIFFRLHRDAGAEVSGHPAQPEGARLGAPPGGGV